MIDLKILKQRIISEELTEGKNLFDSSRGKEGCVEIIGIQYKKRLIGTVKNDCGSYRIKIDLETWRNKCTCSLGGNCRHVYALALEYINRGSHIFSYTSLRNWLKDCDRELLLALIQNLVKHEPYIIKEIIAGGAFIPFYKECDEIKKVKNNLKLALHNVHHGEIGETFETRFYKALEILKQLIAAERYDDAFLGYIYALEAIVKAVDMGYAEDDITFYSLTDDTEEITKIIKEIIPNVSERLRESIAPRIKRIIAKDVYDLGVTELSDII